MFNLTRRGFLIGLGSTGVATAIPLPKAKAVTIPLSIPVEETAEQTDINAENLIYSFIRAISVNERIEREISNINHDCLLIEDEEFICNYFNFRVERELLNAPPVNGYRTYALGQMRTEMEMECLVDPKIDLGTEMDICFVKDRMKYSGRFIITELTIRSEL